MLDLTCFISPHMQTLRRLSSWPKRRVVPVAVLPPAIQHQSTRKQTATNCTGMDTWERERFRCLILFHLYRTPTAYRGAVAFYWKSSASMDVDVDVECWGSRVQSTGHISAMQTSTLNSGTVHLLNTNQFSVFVFFFLLVIWVLHCSLFFFIIDWKSLFDVDIWYISFVHVMKQWVCCLDYSFCVVSAGLMLLGFPCGHKNQFFLVSTV